MIDYKHQIIPNRLTLTLFEVGLVFAFIYGLSNIAISINMILGMVAGAGIFLLITLIGGMVYGKEAMGFGDVKLMGCLGLWFGLSEIIIMATMCSGQGINVIFNRSNFKYSVISYKNKKI